MSASRGALQQSGPRRSTLRQDRHGKTALSRASMLGSGMNCSMVRSSTRSPRPRSSLRAGGATTTPCAHTVRWATSPLRRRSSCPPWPRERLCNPIQLRRPRWRRGRQCTNIPSGPFSGGRSGLLFRLAKAHSLCPDCPAMRDAPRDLLSQSLADVDSRRIQLTCCVARFTGSRRNASSQPAAHGALRSPGSVTRSRDHISRPHALLLLVVLGGWRLRRHLLTPGSRNLSFRLDPLSCSRGSGTQNLCGASYGKKGTPPSSRFRTAILRPVWNGAAEMPLP